ncbi:hypothetical protein [Raineyella sp.]|uniref:ABC3 transporter permease protein domain-containing protein n=1 Tax=bioreactor metagenome TaxID=1076179 RepID=A0A644Y380_9ZZZZ|nr:hypothetical protein [Raineyella sp.]MEA5154020.1 hypothetical protein [Raineyella sp.]
MIIRVLRGSYLLAILSGLLFGWVAATIYDESGITVAGSYVVVRDAEPDANLTAIPAAMEDFAHAHRVNIAEQVLTLDNSLGSRNLYLFVGDPKHSSARWLSDGYPSFSHAVRTTVQSADELGDVDPRAYYYVMAGPQVAESLAAHLRPLGVSAVAHDNNDPSSFVRVFVDTPVWWGFVIITLTGAALAVAAVLGNAESYGAQRLLGRSYGVILLRDLRLCVRPMGLALGIGAITSASAHLMRNGFGHQAGTLALVSGILIVSQLLVSLLAHSTAVALTFRTSVVDALKGELPSDLATVAVAAIRIPALIMTVVIATTWLSTTELNTLYRTQRHHWDTAAVFIATSGTVTTVPTRDQRDGTPWVAIGQMVRQADTQGQVILAKESRILTDGPPLSSVIVNPTLLTAQPLLTTDGSTLRAPRSSDEALIGIPIQRWEQRDAILAAVGRDFHDTAQYQGATAPRRLIPVQLQNDQQVFTYGNALYQVEHYTVNNAVVIALPAGSPAVTDDNLAAWSTQQGIVFTDKESATAAVRAHRLDRVISGIRTVASAGAEQMYQRALTERILVIALGAGTLSIVVTSVATATVFVSRHRRRIFVRHIHGWPLPRIIALPLIGDLTVTTGLAAWGVSRQARTVDIIARGFPAPDPHLAACALLIAFLGATATAIILARISQLTILDSTADA